ncbi:MAG: cold shock and DUF1294 domain-containing protein [Gammaproteobacteria bacterium]
MRYEGRLSNWNDEKGYGFVTPNGGGERAFVHIKAFSTIRRRPVDGDIITYEVTSDARNRFQAKSISYAGESRPAPRRETSQFAGVVVVTLFSCLVVASVALGKTPVPVLFLYFIASCITFVVYAFDKSAAMNNRWRTQEGTLHLLSLIGGWPGALIAQRMFRHKSKKKEFQFVFWLIVIVNCALLVWSASPSGASVIRKFVPTI